MPWRTCTSCNYEFCGTVPTCKYCRDKVKAYRKPHPKKTKKAICIGCGIEFEAVYINPVSYREYHNAECQRKNVRKAWFR